jgi:hypothetical protein
MDMPWPTFRMYAAERNRRLEMEADREKTAAWKAQAYKWRRNQRL